MNAFSNQKLIFALFIVSFLIVPKICTAEIYQDLDLSAEILTSYHFEHFSQLHGQIRVILYWRPLEGVSRFVLHADGYRMWVQMDGDAGSSNMPVFTSYYSVHPHDYSGADECREVLLSMWDAKIEDYLSSNHIFKVVAERPYGRPSIYDELYWEPPPLIATELNPPDGSIAGESSITLRWTPGRLAASHDVYFGDNFDDVKNGAEGTFYGNQVDTYFIAGIPKVGLSIPAYPDGLFPETTYYWRIDEVERNGTTKYKGNIWSFTTPPQIAYDPAPPDGAKFKDQNVEFGWAAGFGGVLHDVYLGTDFAHVKDANISDSSGIYRGQQVDSSYAIEELDLGQTFYWRIDEVEADGTTIHKGDVWSFTTAGPGGGVRGDYFKGVDLKNHVLTRIDPQINFNWDDGAPDEDIGEDNFSVRWTGDVEAAFTETYTFYTNSADGVRLWVDGQLIIDNWTDHTPTEDNGKIDLVAGQQYFIEMWLYERDNSAVAELRWESSRTPKQIVPQAAMSPPFRARSPSPANRATHGQKAPVLFWTPGDKAFEHDVYFGADFGSVNDADISDTTGTYRGRQTDRSYATGELDQQTYYWRIDDYNTDGTVTKGKVWSFTVADVFEETVEYQVSSSKDDVCAFSETLQNLDSDYLKVGTSIFNQPPYYISGMVFRNVNIPRGADIISAYLRIQSYDSCLTGTVYGKIQAEATDDATTFGGSHRVGSLPKTTASVDWILDEPWSEDTWYDSPDIADVIQEVIDRDGWSANNSLAILYGTWWSKGSYRNFSSYDRDSIYAPKLEITVGYSNCPTITIGTETSDWDYPMHTNRQDSRTQVIYLASEIGRGGTIMALALDVTKVPDQLMENWTIRMKHTTLSEYNTCVLDATEWTVVYKNEEAVASGWQRFEFQTPFEYNGTDNLLVDFSHNNSSYTQNGQSRVSSPGGARSVYAYSDSSHGDPLYWSGSASPPVFSSTYIPNVKLTFCKENKVICEDMKITASDSERDDHFGYSVSISGDYAVVGAFGDDYNAGSAYVFKHSDTSWTQQAKLTALERSNDDYFACSVSISGDYAIIGTGDTEDPSDPKPEWGSFCAYIFKRNGTSWIQQAELRALGGEDFDYFGSSVSIDGDYAIVGAPYDADYNEWGKRKWSLGSAYIFKRNATSWTQQAKLWSSDSVFYEGEYFGSSVSINGDYVIIGGKRRNTAYIFKREGTSWIKQAELIALDDPGDSFSHSVSISGEYAIVGAPKDDNNNAYDCGSAYIFKRNGTSWTQQAKLIDSDGESNDYFGSSVSIDGDYAIIGAKGDDDYYKRRDCGSACIFKREGTSWIKQAKLTALDRTYDNYFGNSVSIDGDYIIIGAKDGDNKIKNHGSAYMFKPKLICQFAIGDFDGDDVTDFVDFSIFALHWLGSDSNFLCVGGSTDLVNDNKVDFNDLKEFFENWLACVDN